VSLAAHAAVIWALVRLVPRAQPPARSVSRLEVTLVPRQPPVAPSAAVPAAAAGPAGPAQRPPSVRRPRASPVAAGPPLAASGPSSSAGAPAGGTVALPDPPPARGSPAWTEAEGLAGATAARAPPALDAHLPSGDGGAEPAPSADADPSAPDATSVTAARVRGTLTATFADLEAEERTRFPDPYWMLVRDALGAGLNVPWETLGRGGPDESVVTRSRAAQAARGLLRFHPAEDAPPPRDGGRLSGTARGVLGASRPENRLFVSELRVQVELSQAGDGSVLSYRLTRSSGNGAFDALVLARFAALASDRAAALGPPPPQGRRTRWAVSTRFEMVPPVPIVGCGFDANFHLTGCFYPLKRSTHTRIELQRLWD